MRFERIGHYDVTALIGEGGMGQVYQATDTKLNRQVALKILPEAFATDPDRLARFQREAQVLASLNHPNIAQIHGIEEQEGTRALVLELVEGPTLADRISKGPIPIDEALPIAKQVAEALEAAHEQGIIHRDLKPANVVVKDDGTVKVLDFGLAKAFRPDANDPNLSQSPTISLTAAATQMGMVIGTAAYMAPEQASGKAVDKRADVWAFGVVLYEMLTGTRPFVGDDVSKTLAHVIAIDPDWSVLPKNVPPVLGTFLRGCLEKDPKQRVHDIADVRLAMDGAFETTASTSAEPTAASPVAVWQRPVPLLLAGLVLAAVSGLAGWSLTRPARPRVVRFPIPLAVDQEFSNAGRPLVAISPDGSQIVYAANGGLWLRSVDQLQAVQVPGIGGGARGPFFSADGQSLGFWVAGQLKKVAVSGGAPVSLADLPTRPRGASWGADDMILYGQPDGIMQVPGASGRPELLIAVEEGEAIYGPQMLPGGEWVLFTLSAGGDSPDEAQIVTQSVTTGERTMLIDGGLDGRYLPTGHLLYFLNGVLLAVPFDVGSRQVVGGPVPLVEGVRRSTASGGDRPAQFSVSTNGSLVYVQGTVGGDGLVSLVWLDRNDQEERIAAPLRAYGNPRVSPDGTRVAVDITDGDGSDIWLWDLARETLTQLTFDEGVDTFPLWTLDSERVVFNSSRDGGGLFWKAADGTGQAERIMEGAARPYAWAEDGRLIFEQNQDIGALMMEGERTVETVLSAETFEGAPTLSPDGRWLAYSGLGPGGPLIYVVPFHNTDDGLWNVSLTFGLNPVWSPDGHELFYRSNSLAGMMVAQIQTEPTFSATTPESLLDLTGYTIGGFRGRYFDLAPTGDRFIFLTPGTAEMTDDDPFNGLIFVENWFEELTARVPVN